MDMDTEFSTSSSSDSDDIIMEDFNEYEEYMQMETIVYARMNNTISKLTDELVLQYELSVPKVLMDPQGRQEYTKGKIEEIFLDLVKQICETGRPVLRIRDRLSWKNCIFNDTLCLKTVEECTLRVVKFFSKKSIRKFCLIYFVMGKIYRLLSDSHTCTKRELYYQNINHIKDQAALDSILNDISCLLDCPLYHLNIYATSKGLISGPLKIITNRDVIDCGLDLGPGTYSRGVMIPNDVCNIINLQTDAKFVLLIEKDAVFQKLLEIDAMSKLPPCLFVTGKGMPDINTRSLLKLIWDTLHIPILAFVDADPWGIDIMCIYRFGSRALSHQADVLAVPSIRWLGPFPSEVSKLCDDITPLTNADKGKIIDLLDRPYMKVNKKIGFELQYMLTTSLKAEIEDLGFSAEYMINVYLPHKVSLGDFI